MTPSEFAVIHGHDFIDWKDWKTSNDNPIN